MNTSTNVANIPAWQNLSLENLPNEIWKPINGYEGLYKISNLGRVRSLDRAVKGVNGLTRKIKSILNKGSVDKDGYIQFNLYKFNKGTKFKSHRLVAAHFIGESNLMVNHKDLIKTNNFVDNLEYVTNIENCVHYHLSEEGMKRKTSKYVGIGLCKITKKWRARKTVSGRRYCIGIFKSEELAKIAYDSFNPLK